MSRRLLCVYQHAPTPGAPGIYRHRLLLSGLVERGWEVDLVSTPVNYMTGVTDPNYAGKPYIRESIDGVEHHWVWASSRIHASRARRATNYLSFAATALARSGTLRRPDVIMVSSPPLSVAALGPVLAGRFRRPWVLEVRDPWPDTAGVAGWLSEDSTLWELIGRAQHRLTTSAAAVVVQTPGLVGRALRQNARMVGVVPPAVLDRRIDDRRRAIKRAELGLEDDACLFVYTGAVGLLNGLDTLLDAVRLVADDLAFQVAVVGDGSARRSLDERIARERIGRVRLIGAVGKDEVADWLAAADVCLHLLRPDERLAYALPSKVFEYFGAHRPFVTTASGVAQRLAERSGGSFAADANALAVELARWAGMSVAERSERGEQAFDYGSRLFGRDTVVDRLESLLAHVVASRSSRTGSSKSAVCRVEGRAPHRDSSLSASAKTRS